MTPPFSSPIQIFPIKIIPHLVIPLRYFPKLWLLGPIDEIYYTCPVFLKS